MHNIFLVPWPSLLPFCSVLLCSVVFCFVCTFHCYLTMPTPKTYAPGRPCPGCPFPLLNPRLPAIIHRLCYVTCLPDECKITDPGGIGKISRWLRGNPHTHTHSYTHTYGQAHGCATAGKTAKNQQSQKKKWKWKWKKKNWNEKKNSRRTTKTKEKKSRPREEKLGKRGGKRRLW